MNSIIFILVMFILSLVFERIKEGRTEDTPLKKKKLKQKSSPVNIDSNSTRIKVESFERKPRVIVDREKEIVSNSLTFDKERILNDIIFSEVLSKPKSKR